MRQKNRSTSPVIDGGRPSKAASAVLVGRGDTGVAEAAAEDNAQFHGHGDGGIGAADLRRHAGDPGGVFHAGVGDDADLGSAPLRRSELSVALLLVDFTDKPANSCGEFSA